MPFLSPAPVENVRPTTGNTVPVNPAQFADWDDLVLARPQGSIFHSAAWARVLVTAYGFKPVYLLSLDGGGADTRRFTRSSPEQSEPSSAGSYIHGPSILPLMEVDSWLTGRRGIALPFTDECDPLYADPDAGRQLIQNALQFGKNRGWKTVEIRGGRELVPDAPASLWFYGHRLNLAADEETQFARLDGSVRRAIRKAEKSGVTVSVSQDPGALKTFYALQCRTRKKHGLPPQPFAFFQNIYRHILSNHLGIVVIAASGNRPIAASVYFQLGDRAVFKYGASDESFQQLRGSNLAMWEAIKWLARRGARTLSMGRTSLGNEGLRRFKLGWGAEEYNIEYMKYDLRKGAFVTETDGVTGWHNRVFRALPLSLSRLIGAVLYRHWA